MPRIPSMRFGLVALVLSTVVACSPGADGGPGSGGRSSGGGASGGATGGRGGAPAGGSSGGSGGLGGGVGGRQQTGGSPGTGGGGTGGTGGTTVGTGGSASGGSQGGEGGAVGGGGRGAGTGGLAGAPGTGGTAGASGGGGQASSGGAGDGGGGSMGAGGVGGGAGPSLGTTSCGRPWVNLSKGDTWTHDPTLTREGDVYYMFYTRSPETGARVPFKTSADGVTWTNRGNVFAANLPWWNDDIAMPEIWAPDILKVNGTYYLYYSVSAWGNFNSSIGLATNSSIDPSSPSYRWIDRGKVIDFRNGGAGVNVIDPNLFVDGDATFWLVYGSYRSGIRLTQLDPGTGKLLRQPPELTVLTNSLGEGSSIIKHNGYYYLMVSTGTCCAQLNSTYHVVMGRSRNLKGPYLTKENRRMLDGAGTVFLGPDASHPGQGGQSFYQENGKLYMVYHAYTRPTGDPKVSVRPVFFDAGDWPTLDPCLAAR